jgi:hypothetical protein
MRKIMKMMLLKILAALLVLSFTSCEKAKKDVKEAAATSAQVVKDDLKQTAEDTKTVLKDGYDSIKETSAKIKNDVDKD